LALGPGDLGLIRFQRIADRGLDVSLCGRLISRFRCTISGLSGPVGLVPVVFAGHRTKPNHATEPSVARRG
jgi:hypothetical protein